MLHNRFAHRQAQFDLLRRGIFQHACKFNRNTDVRMNRNVASKQSVKINAQCCRYIHQLCQARLRLTPLNVADVLGCNTDHFGKFSLLEIAADSTYFNVVSDFLIINHTSASPVIRATVLFCLYAYYTGSHSYNKSTIRAFIALIDIMRMIFLHFPRAKTIGVHLYG